MTTQSFPTYAPILPLNKDTSAYSRHITVTSCRLNETHLQVRGELVDSRADYHNSTTEIPVHGIVVRLNIQIVGLLITEANIELPKMAFDDVCRRSPHSGEALVGVSIKRGFLQKVEEIYGGDRSCFHLYSLLCAMTPALAQVRAWNDSFRTMDAHMPAEAIPGAMQIMRNSIKDTCYAWRSDGEVIRNLDNQKYEPLLQRIAPNLLKRWQDQESKK